MAVNRLAHGQRDCLVTITQIADADVNAVDDSGTPVDIWTTLGTAWMSKRDAGQNERFTAHQLSAPVDTEWQMPYQSNMDPEIVDVSKRRRLVYKTRAYDIQSATLAPRDEGRYITLMTLSGGTIS